MTGCGFVFDATGANVMTSQCNPLTAIPKRGQTINGVAYGSLDEISPGSTPFAAQFGVRFQF